MCLASSLAAQPGEIDKRLVLGVAPEFGAVRGHAPLSLSVSLKWVAPELLEGDLQLEWFVDETKLGRSLIPDLALADSSLNFSVMVPPVVLPYDEAAFSVHGTFLTDNAVYNLDVHDVALQPDWRRILLVGVCGEPKPLVDSRMDALANVQRAILPRSFDLVPFFKQRFTQRELFVDDIDVNPEDVPTDPLRMTAFDLFVVPGESIGRLKRAQRDCLLTWVKAGGSLCVFVDSAISKDHVAWLNQLAGRDAAEAVYLSGADGDVVSIDSSANGIHQYRTGLGRAVVVFDQPALDSDVWRQTVLFLWKVRSDRRSASLNGLQWEPLFVRTGRVPRQVPGGRQPGVSQTRTYGSNSSARLLVQNENRIRSFFEMSPRRLWRAPELTELLLPESVRGLPLATVCLILMLFLLAIAPGDYWLLGLLKRRRWTWVLFPALSLLFTGFTMWTAQQHLGRTSYLRSITVTDVGDDGEPVRTSRFEMLYSASNRQELTEGRRSLMVPLDPDPERLMLRRIEPALPRQYEQAWTYFGHMPRHYTVFRDIQQWAPRMARLTSFALEEGNESVIGIDWDRLHAGESSGLPSSGPARALRMTSQGAFPLISRADAIPEEIVGLAHQITRRPVAASGFFSVVSQISPTGSGNWEDLALLDPSDPQREVLVVITNPEEGHYVIYRRLEVRK